MQNRFRWVALVMVLGLVVPAFADDKKAKDNLVPAGQIEGKLTRVETEKKTVALEVTSKVVTGVDRRTGPRYQDQKKTFEYPLADDVQVLRQNLPVELDDKGKPKKPSAADLKKKVKGPGNLKGYPADLDSVKKDQIVILFLKAKKEALKPAPRAKKEDKEFLDDKPMVTTIYIIRD
jgi:hypothetical protein